MNDAPGQRPISPTGAVAAEIDAAFDRQRRFDALGYRIHLAVAIAMCVLICGPILSVQIAVAPPLICFLIRIWGIHPLEGYFGRTALARLLLAWAAWCLLSVAWSMDRAQTVAEMTDLRWVAAPFMLWAVLDRRRWLVAALATGLMVGSAAAWGRELWPETFGIVARARADRVSGWWHPVVAGSLLTAGLGLHLPAAMLGRGRVRIVGIIGAAAMGAGVLATGSRGAWIGSTALVAATLVWAVMHAARARGADVRRAVVRIVAGVGVAAVVVGAAALAAGDGVTGALKRRLSRGVEEVRAALQEGDYASDTGARIQMAIWAAEAFAERPLHGVGMGAYRAWVKGHLAEQGIDPATRNVHGHAHNAVLEIAATLGGVGLGLAAAIVIVALRGELRRAREAAESALAGTGSGSAWAAYDLGPACALVGMVLVSPFDPVHLNAQSAPMLWTLIGLCATGRPTPAGSVRADQVGD